MLSDSDDSQWEIVSPEMCGLVIKLTTWRAQIESRFRLAVPLGGFTQPIVKGGQLISITLINFPQIPG